MPLLYELSCVRLLDIKSSDPCCYKDTFSARCFAYFFGNVATMRTNSLFIAEAMIWKHQQASWSLAI